MRKSAYVWDWKPTFHIPNVRSHSKKVLFPAFQLPCDPSKAVLMQTQQKDGQLQNSPTLSSPPSHYLIRYCGYTINFLSLAVLFNSLLLVYYVPAIKALQYEHIDSGVNDSEYHGKPIRFCRALSMNKIWLLHGFKCSRMLHFVRWPDSFVSNFCERFLYFPFARQWITSKPGESETTKTGKFWSGKESVWACAVCGQVQLCVCVCLSLLIKVPAGFFLAWGAAGVSVCQFVVSESQMVP